MRKEHTAMRGGDFVNLRADHSGLTIPQNVRNRGVPRPIASS